MSKSSLQNSGINILCALRVLRRGAEGFQPLSHGIPKASDQDCAVSSGLGEEAGQQLKGVNNENYFR